MAARRGSLLFIFITIALDTIALGIIIPVLPQLVEQFYSGDTAVAARMYGVLGSVWALMQFFCAPILGSLSDRYGRRPVLLLSCLGLGLDYIVMALAPNIGWLFLGRVLSGVCAASFTSAGAYIADVTPPEKRAAGFGMMGAAWGLGFVTGPAIGGLLGGLDPRTPFWAAAVMSLLNFLYGWFVLPESLPPEKRSAFSWKKANPVGSLTLLRSHRDLLGLGSVSTLYFMGHQVLPSICVLYCGYRYGWGPKQMGLMLAVVGILNMLVQGLLVKRVVAWLGDRRALLVGLFFGGAGFLWYALAPSGALFWFGAPIFALVGFFNPASQSLMTRRVAVNEQGQLQGALGSIMGITGVIAPLMFTATFAHFIAPGRAWALPGAPFLLAAALTFAALLIALGVARAPAPGTPA